MALLVRCTEKLPAGEPHTRVISLGGTLRDGSPWKVDVATAIAQVERGEQTYYVEINGFTPNLIVALHRGVKYLRSPFDRDVLPATLLGLPDF